jgi:hypothetical protein
LLQPDISIVQELRLPCFDRAPGMPLMAYPLPQPNFTVEFVNSIPPDTFDWRNWHEEIERRNGRLKSSPPARSGRLLKQTRPIRWP